MAERSTFLGRLLSSLSIFTTNVKDEGDQPSEKKEEECCEPKNNEQRLTNVEQPVREVERTTETEPLQDENVDLKTKMESLQNENEDLTTKIEHVENKNNNLSINVRLLEDRIAVERRKVKRLQDENVDLTTKMERVQNENIDLITQMRRLGNDNEDARNENRNLKLINELMQEDNKRVQLANLGPMMELQLNGLEYFKKIKELQEENSMLSNEIEQLRQEKCCMVQQHEEEEGKLKDQIEQLRGDKRKVKQKYKQLREEKCQISAQIEKLRRENKEKNNENRQLREENASKYSEIQQNERDKNAMSNEIEELRKEREAMGSDLQALRQECTSMKIEIKQLQDTTKSSFITECGTVRVSDVELGRGGYAAVYKGDFHGTEVAVKEYYHVIISPHNMKMLEREINIAAQCRHPNLLQFLCATKNERNNLLIVTELMDMTLRSLLEQRGKKNSRLNEQEIKLISLDVARGLNYLHLKKPSPLIHRDISSANVLLSIEHGEVRRAKISDYGSVNFMEVCATPNPGATIYAAPEARHAQHSPKIDVFSYGLLVCEMFISKLPNKDIIGLQVKRIKNERIESLVNICTAMDPQKRPTMSQVISSWQEM